MKSDKKARLMDCLQSNSSQDLNETCRKIICEDLTDSSSFWLEHSDLLRVLLSETSFEIESNSDKKNRLRSIAPTAFVSVIVTALLSMIKSLNLGLLVFVSLVVIAIVLLLITISMNWIDKLLPTKSKTMTPVKKSGEKNYELKEIEDKLNDVLNKISSLERAYKQLSTLLDNNEKSSAMATKLEEKLKLIQEQDRQLKAENSDLMEVKKNFEDALGLIMDEFYKIHNRGSQQEIEYYEGLLDILINSTRYRLLYYENDKERLVKYFKWGESEYVSAINETPALMVYNTNNEIVDCLKPGRIVFPAGQAPTE